MTAPFSNPANHHAEAQLREAVQHLIEEAPPTVQHGPRPANETSRLRVTYYPSDSSVFFGTEYVTRAVPGRILWKLLNEMVREGRSEFTNRELRHEPALKLPAVRDNLETRLYLLRNRLDDKFPFARMFRTGRGRFRLEMDRDLELHVGS